MTKLEKLMSTEVTRGQFLSMLGVGILGLFGLSSLLGIVSKGTPAHDQVVNYGMLNYGP